MNAVECILNSTPERAKTSEGNNKEHQNTAEKCFSMFKPVDDDDDIFMMQIPKLTDDLASLLPVKLRSYSLRKKPKRKSYDEATFYTARTTVDEDFPFDKRKRSKRATIDDEELPDEHSLSTSSPKPFICEQCDFRTSTSAALMCHKKKHVSKGEYYSCFVCYESFGVKHLRNNHIEDAHMNKDSGVYVCQCDKNFDDFMKFRTHCRYSHNVKIHRCPVCDKTFKRIDKLKRHVTTHDKTRRDFLCCRCGLTFRRMDKLKEHEKKQHDNTSMNDVRMKKRNKKTKNTISETNFLDDAAVFKSPAEHHSSGLMDVQAMTPGEFSTLLATNSFSYDDQSNACVSAEFNDDSSCTFKCLKCSTEFKRHGMFKNHMKINHPDVDLSQLTPFTLPVLKSRTRYRCPFCPSYDDSSVFHNMSRLEAHINRIHKGYTLGAANASVKVKVTSTSATVKCKFCNLGEYVNAWKLEEHLKEKHADELLRIHNKNIDDKFKQSIVNRTIDMDELFDKTLEGIDRCDSHLENSPSVCKVRLSRTDPIEADDNSLFVPAEPSSFLANLPVENQHDLISFCVPPTNGLNHNSTSLFHQQPLDLHYSVGGSLHQLPLTLGGDNFSDAQVEQQFSLLRPFTPVTPLPVAMLNNQLLTPQYSTNFLSGDSSCTFGQSLKTVAVPKNFTSSEHSYT